MEHIFLLSLSNVIRWFICYYAYLTARSTSQHTSPHLSVTVSVFIHEKLSNENKRTSEHHNWLIIPWHCWLVVAVRCQCWDTGTMTIYQWQECHYRCYHQQHTGPIHTSITMTQSRVYIQMNILNRGMWYCDMCCRVAWLTLECSRKIGHSGDSMRRDLWRLTIVPQ